MKMWSTIVVTGADGFLGWHTRVRLFTMPGFEVRAIGRAGFAGPALEEAVADADAVLHLAGINRASDDEVEHGNLALAQRLVDALEATGSRARVVYSGSTQSDQDTPYGRGKRRAGEHLAQWGQRAHSAVVESRLPGLYGEHGRPDYNSFVATFAHRIARGEQPSVVGDRPLPLLHAQDAAAHLIAATDPDSTAGIVRQAAPSLGISWVADRLARFRDVYANGEIPRLSDGTDVRLFNTLRAAWWDQRKAIPLTPRSDSRGRLVEVVRQHGGQGQTFLSTTVPGVRRGDHFHLHKIERFAVVAGQGLIRLRKMLTDEIVEIPVDGSHPVAVDMPTLWTHSIENVGESELVTMFWVNELFDPDNPDTHPEPVLQEVTS